MSEETPEKEAHGGCLAAYERERRRADFAEARLGGLSADLHRLASLMDGIGGHATHERLGGKTLGGAVRWTLNDLTFPPGQARP